MPSRRGNTEWLIVAAALAVVLVVALSGALRVQAQAVPPPSVAAGQPLSFGFTYQGLIKKNGVPVNDTCSFQFGLWDQLSGGLQIGITETTAAAVSNGLAAVLVNDSGAAFGPQAFNGQARFLAIQVKCGAEPSYTPLGRQALTPAPYALALPGLRTEPNATSPNLIGGYISNTVTAGVVGATIAGGGQLGDTNRVTDDFGTVAGGTSNRAGNAAGATDDAINATVGGGESNSAGGTNATIAGGQDSNANGDYAFVGGGGDNDATGLASVVAGGIFNQASGQYATVGGGYSNSATGLTATVPGGQDNLASGNYSFAAGRNAHATHTGAFLWADGSTTTTVTTDRNNQFKIKAAGGVVITATATSGLTPAALEVQNGGSNSVAISAVQTSLDATLVVANNGSGDLIKAYSAAGLRFLVNNAGNVTADGSFTGGGADFAEMLPATPGLEAGDVLVIGPDGRLTCSTTRFATTVAGVYSTRPGFIGAPQDGATPDAIPLAVVGVVPVKASAENGPIHPGDLLVTASLPGYAMRAGPNPPVGTVIGKALSVLNAGTGQIQMLVVLQ